MSDEESSMSNKRHIEENDDDDEFLERDQFVPKANVTRIMQSALPEKTKIANDAKDTMVKIASEFVSFLSSEAHDTCVQDGKRTICGHYILVALETLGFDQFVEPLAVYNRKVLEAIELQQAVAKERKKLKSADAESSSMEASSESSAEEESETTEEVSKI